MLLYLSFGYELELMMCEENTGETIVALAAVICIYHQAAHTTEYTIYYTYTFLCSCRRLPFVYRQIIINV